MLLSSPGPDDLDLAETCLDFHDDVPGRPGGRDHRDLAGHSSLYQVENINLAKPDAAVDVYRSVGGHNHRELACADRGFELQDFIRDVEPSKVDGEFSRRRSDTRL